MYRYVWELALCQKWCYTFCFTSVSFTVTLIVTMLYLCFQVCAITVVFVVFVIVFMPIPALHGLMSHLCQCWAIITILAKMAYQLRLVPREQVVTNCTVSQ